MFAIIVKLLMHLRKANNIDSLHFDFDMILLR